MFLVKHSCFPRGARETCEKSGTVGSFIFVRHARLACHTHNSRGTEACHSRVPVRRVDVRAGPRHGVGPAFAVVGVSVDVDAVPDVL